jgi:hypothetical protein
MHHWPPTRKEFVDLVVNKCLVARHDFPDFELEIRSISMLGSWNNFADPRDVAEAIANYLRLPER